MNNSEIMGDLEMQKLDIHGNPVDVYLDDTDTEYVPLYQVKRTGFHLFDPQNFNERLISNEYVSINARGLRNYVLSFTF